MKNKSERFELIRQIISNEVISNQDELLMRLLEVGMEVTQATLSRDLKSLQVIKVSDGKGGYAYRMANHDIMQPHLSEPGPVRLALLADGVLGINFSGNLGVMKTLPGFASSIALAIDEASVKEILGTIAGDDTILIVVKEGVGRSEVIRALISVMPKLEQKL
ncbi:MAG: ArgR family transcriptional regulator [Marinilabiliales bacterium]|nr:ArgR family transcriptional regulator [Marinilabiliales bacterium]